MQQSRYVICGLNVIQMLSNFSIVIILFFLLNFVEGPSSPRSESPEPGLTSMISSGAEILRRKLLGVEVSPNRQSRVRSRTKIQLSEQETNALRSLRLMEKVESIGLENIMPSHTSNTRVHTRTSSPGLRKLSDASTSSCDSGNVTIDKKTIKAILSKGLSNDSLKSLSSVNSDESSSSASNTLNQSGGAQDARSKQLQRQRSRKALVNRNSGGERPDLGVAPNTIGRTVKGTGLRPDLGRVSGVKVSQNKPKPKEKEPQPEPLTGFQYVKESVVGTVSSLFFGRKGGLL